MSQHQKGSRATVCQELLERANGDEIFTKQIITGDETRGVDMVMMSRQKSNHHRVGRQIVVSIISNLKNRTIHTTRLH